ncbi:MAG: HDOD domain-containing protein [Gammaproteobacteria bacterium]|nr:HDOD domain-containing protein [Gammaproteobacteria bacterium]
MKHKLAVAASILNRVKLPKIPNEVSRLQDESLKPDPDVIVISECISRNPKLLTKFLTVASFVTKKEIKTARQAVDALGTKGVFTVFFSSSIEFSFQATGDSIQIVNHAIKIATAMGDLAMHVEEMNPSDAYLYGLLYNVGYIVLSLYDPDGYKACYLASVLAPSTSEAKELEAYGTTNNFIGVYVAKKWHVRNAIYSGILFQQSSPKKCPDGKNKAYELVNLLNIARSVVGETEEARYLTDEVRLQAKESMTRLNIGNIKYINAQKKVRKMTKDLQAFPKDFLEEEA